MKTIYENLFPAAVLFGWMLSSAYTLYLVASASGSGNPGAEPRRSHSNDGSARASAA